MKIQTPNIYNYLTPGKYLHDYWKAIKDTNQSFSIRSWAYQLGMKGHNPLYEILKEKRKLPKHYLPKLIKNLSLSVEEGIYLETIVDIQRAQSISEKEMYLNRLKSLSPLKQIELVEVENYHYIKDPLHAVILEMTDLKDFIPNAKWISQNLAFKTSIIEVEMILKRLINLGLLTKNKEGKLKKNIQNLTSKQDFPSKAVQSFHKEIAKWSMEQISKQKVGNREYGSHIFNIERKNITKAKLKLRNFINEFISEFESLSQEGEQSYIISAQFFRITKELNEKHLS